MPYQISRFGWLPDPPDFRDYRTDSGVVDRALKAMSARAEGVMSSPPQQLPGSVDVSALDSPVEDQEQLGSCTAHAVVGLVEHLERSLYQRYLDGSRLFLYKATRSFLGWTGDTGAFVRSTIKALRLFGVCPEQHWPYDISQFDVEPSAFCYAYGGNYKALAYYRLEGLDSLKASLAQGLPFAFGFSVFDSIWRPEVKETGVVPMPGPMDQQVGGHAVMAVGYDDERGALMFRNSWGTSWGDRGYGWLPYEYVTRGLAQDFWVLAKMAYEDVEEASRGG